MIDAGVASALVVGGSGLILGLVTQRNNHAGQAATTKIDERKVDREEFDSLTRELRAQMSDLRTELAQERELRGLSDERAIQAEKRAEQAERRATEAEKNGAAATRRLGQRVEQLEQALTDAGLTVPPRQP